MNPQGTTPSLTQLTAPWRERLFSSFFPYLVSDVFAVMAAYFVTWLIRFHSVLGDWLFTSIRINLGVQGTTDTTLAYESFYFYNAPRILFLLTITLAFLYGFLTLYAGRRFMRRRYISRNIILANFIALGIFYGYFYLTRNQFHPRSVFVTLLMLNVVFGLTLRQLVSQLLKKAGLTRCPALLLGTTPEADFLDRYIAVHHPHGIEVAGCLPFDPNEKFEQFLDKLADLAQQRRTQMIICADKRLTVAQIMQILERFESLCQEVKVLSDKLGVVVNEAGLPADFFVEMPLVHFSVPPTGFTSVGLRRAVALLLSLAILTIAAPLFLMIALLIKSTSRGPVLFIQERIGINRKPFRMYKFRTMYDRAEELQAQIEEFNESGEGLFKIRKDPRVTPVGRFLRRFSLDEVPQLINVLRGEMTWVGPRPLPRRDFENYYEEWHYSRHSGLPGLTCLWQVSGRSDISFHNMCILDDYYLRNQSVMLDLRILLKTIGVVLFAKGAY